MQTLFFLLLVFVASFSHAVEMNLNEYAPTRLEDASPTDEHKLDLQLSSVFEQEDPNQMQVRFNPRYGISKEAQLEAVANFFSGGDERGSGRIKLGGLYQFTDSRGFMPKIALSPFLVAPSGKYDQRLGYDNKLLVSWTLQGANERPEAEIHLNFGHSYHPIVADDERYNQFLFAFGYSYQIKRYAALVIDYFHQLDEKKTEEENMLETGIQHDLGNDTFLAVGGGAAVGAGPSWSGNLSLTKQY